MKQIPVDSSAIADGSHDDGVHRIARDLAYKRLVMVNVVFYGEPAASHGGPASWVLIDAGLPATAGRIVGAAEHLFGKDVPPAAIILTHGHFDHVGALAHLAERWSVPIYAHEQELPYLNGRESYPPPDPRVGGLMALTSPLYPRGPIDVSQWLLTLPVDGSVPGMPRFRWIHTPGHAVGHVSLWRPDDRTLIAGDAFITTDQESAYAVVTQRPEIHGPPAYFTPDWDNAGDSVRHLATLEPELVITGHGHAMRGEEMRAGLRELAANFDAIAVPPRGKYVHPPGFAE